MRFGFTFAYRFDPATDAAVFSGLRSGGRPFRAALGFVGVDYYLELYPGVTDYRWFNLRDNFSATAAFGETSGLLSDTYRRTPAFAAYRRLIARFGLFENQRR